MATTDLNLAADTSGPAIILSFPGVDLTGYALQMRVWWRGGAITLEAGAGLTLSVTTDADVPTSRVTWLYDREISNSLPLGSVSGYDLFATAPGMPEDRRKIAAGGINVDGPGRLSLVSGEVVELLGLQGPRGWSAVYGTPTYGTSVVLQVTDWTGGVGEKPAIGQYLGPAGWVDDVEDATLFASVASANAAVSAAAASAAAATTQAGNAATSATASATARTGSEAARAGSEAARDAAFINANVYADEATGRAAVADGVQFQVVSTDGLIITRYRRVNSGSSVAVATYPSKLTIDSIFANERVVLSRNLLDISDLTYERAAHNTDTLSVSATQDCSNFIRVVPGRQYYFRQTSAQRHAILGFTARTNASKVGRIGNLSAFGAYTFVMPSGINYVKIGLVGSGETRDPATFSQFSLSEGDFLPTSEMTYNGYYANTSGNSLPFRVRSGAMSEVVSEIAASTNIFDYSKNIYGYNVSASSAIITPVTGSSVSGLMPCAANETFTMAGLDSLRRRVLYYGADGVPISKADVDVWGAQYPGSGTDDYHSQWTVPNDSNIAAFRIQVHQSDPSFFDYSTRMHIYKGTGYQKFTTYRKGVSIDGSTYAPQQSVVNDYIAPFFRRPISFADKRFLFIGDSITSQGQWIARFTKLIRPLLLTNASAGGMRLVSTTGTVNPVSYQNAGPDKAHEVAAQITAATLAAPDYVFICLGTNEFNRSPDTTVAEANIDDAFCSGTTTLSALSSVDLTKIPGAMRYMVQTIGAVAPSAKFFFVTPIPNTTGTWASQRAVGDTIRWTARRMSIPVIDLQARSNILTLWDYPAGVLTYRNLVDGVHPFGTGVLQTPATAMIAEQVASDFLNYVIVST